jgi:hypothetical protein
VALADGTYLLGATLLYKVNASATARMNGPLVLNGTTIVKRYAFAASPSGGRGA